MGLLSFLSRWFRRAFQLVLMALGPVPVHVAFVMDGNRRYAERKHVDKATGHTHGYGKMVEVIHWCMELGVKCITVYAFSIDNFKRAPEEVGALMALAEDKY
ncbi:Dehydrodolichyl diphosphate synthase, partial [Tetrabaena socialis]